MPRERQPTAKYVALMNTRYDRILDAAWGGSELTTRYDGSVWTVTVRHGRREQAAGTGETLEIALGVMEEALGLEKWTG